MKTNKLIIVILNFIVILSCQKKTEKKQLSTIDILEKYPDSINIGGITFNYGFKNQILAHKNGIYDSTLITEKFYKPNQYLFDSCFNFFPTPIYSLKEVKRWNESYMKDYDSIVWKQLKFLINQNIDSLFRKHLNAVQNITGVMGDAKFLAYLPPKGYGISGGCDTKSMAFDLMYKIEDEEYLKRVIPHEIEHTLYENKVGKGPYFKTGIGVTLDEGLATYFELKYLNIPREKIIGSENNFNWFIKNEKIIFDKLEPFFLKELENACTLLYHFDRSSECEPILPNIPNKILEKNLGYILGYRIVEHYEKINGLNSWKEIYQMSPKEFYEKSKYKEYIKKLK